VTLIYRGTNILRGFDDDVRTHLRDEMMARGIDVRCGHTVTRVDQRGEAFSVSLSDGATVVVDKVMFAIGRRPNVNGLGLENAGVRVTAAGAIAVDAFSQTSAPHIYAVGDVTDRVNLTPVAIREGHAFADTVFGGRPIRVDHTDVPTAVFSEPEIGVIGLTETAAREKLERVRTDPGDRDCGEDEGDQSRLRFRDGGPSDGGRGTGHDAHADRDLRSRCGGVMDRWPAAPRPG
jgi:glutathione reductase (NADPH)